MMSTVRMTAATVSFAQLYCAGRGDCLANFEKMLRPCDSVSESEAHHTD